MPKVLKWVRCRNENVELRSQSKFSSPRPLDQCRTHWRIGIFKPGIAPRISYCPAICPLLGGAQSVGLPSALRPMFTHSTIYHMAIVWLRGGTVEAGAYKNLVVLPLHTCRIQVRRAAADSVSFGGKLSGLVVSYVGEAAQAYDTQTAN